MNPVAWDWPTIGKVVVSAGVGSGAAQLLRDWLGRRASRRDHAAYMAMRLSVTLEAYASACSDFISTNENAEVPPDEQYPNWTVTLPALPDYLDDAEGWRSIDRRLAGRCLNLRNKISGSQAMIRSTIEFTEDELGDTLQIQAAERGREAWDLAVALRRKHRIEQAETVWQFPEHLEQALKSGKRSLEKRNSLQAEFLARMARRNTGT